MLAVELELLEISVAKGKRYDTPEWKLAIEIESLAELGLRTAKPDSNILNRLDIWVLLSTSCSTTVQSLFTLFVASSDCPLFRIPRDVSLDNEQGIDSGDCKTGGVGSNLRQGYVPSQYRQH